MKLVTQIVLLILPAFCSAGITVLIRATYGGEVIAEAQGSEDNVVTNKDRKVFKITDSELIDNVKKRYGYKVDYIYVKEPVDDDLSSFDELGFEEVRKELIPIKAKVTEKNDVPTIVCVQEFINKCKYSGTFTSAITQTVETIASTAWSEGKEIGIGAEVSYSLGVASGSASLNFNANWGTETTETTSTTIGSVSGVAVTLEPGQNVTANLHATRGEIKAKFDYTARIHGDVYLVYRNYMHAYDIHYVQETCGCPIVRNATEIMTFKYFSNARVELA